jgi:hypothetical protein
MFAGEGMWLPLLISQLNEKEFRDLGFRLSPEDIYSINNSSLKDAIVLFGGGCTAELVSNQGLILTNHHCGFSNIQRHSTLDHNYLEDGFWAQSMGEELPNQGLTITFLIRMEDVTSKVLAGTLPHMSEKERSATIRKASEKLESEAEKGTTYKASVKSFYNGNQYYLVITETFKDVRLVGAPPSSIGKFGGDTDNWMWPRHTGDFSVFRIYADKDNKPADYSKDNVPYQPRKSLAISLKGVREGDFTFVYGFPGSTQEYLPSYAVDLAVNIRNPIATQLRGEKLAIYNRAMESDMDIRLKYAVKAAGIANFWKKMLGESQGIRQAGGIGKKQDFETQFTTWLRSNPDQQVKYSSLLADYKKSCEDFKPVHRAYTYLTEGALGVEIIRYANGFNNLVKQCNDKKTSDVEITTMAKRLKTGAENHFRSYSPAIDEAVFAALMKLYGNGCNADYQPDFLKTVTTRYKGDYEAWAHDVYKHSIFADSLKMKDFLENFTRKKGKRIEKDPAYMIAISVYSFLQNSLNPELLRFYGKADSLQRVYMKAQMEMQPEKPFYPDANSTLRITYGKVAGYNPADAVNYRCYTTLDGVMEKEDPDISDYQVSPRLRDLYNRQDFGRYAGTDGKMPLAFIATNHTTGGNSGSPVLDADGNLVGINFDRCWEGTMSDMMYDPDRCRNIALDIRYCLFIIEKYAGASRLISEMNIVGN